MADFSAPSYQALYNGGVRILVLNADYILYIRCSSRQRLSYESAIFLASGERVGRLYILPPKNFEAYVDRILRCMQ